ncbi:hypothetical protein DYB32_009433 [Aphanomyces invadans]|uniref:G-protein coupled receptors family 3 profile domain-containing protein n=1 Tax=Aphanomyces invadans TaxID=157072 RepID=A0A418AJF4_9STRA|nr:hypothetical protein DYB32_009433 [Aphanomyces invadans]
MTPTVYTAACGYKETIYGVGSTVDAATGTIVNQGTIPGTFVSEWGGWPTHELTSYVNAILLQEVVRPIRVLRDVVHSLLQLGYDVSFVHATGTYATERMSTMGRGLCTPTHLNPEVWTSSQMAALKVHANESTMANVGYWGSRHVTAVVGNLSRPFSADFWREFTLSDDLIEYFSIDRHNRSRIAKAKYCPDGVGGCLDGCSKSYACTLHEGRGTAHISVHIFDSARTPGKSCMLVLIMRWDYDPGYLQAIMSNRNVPAYFCSAGDSNLQEYVVETMQRNGTIVFYHYVPDMFHTDNPGKFARILWPLPDPAVVATATGTFGELGYGNPTTNPVDVDYPQENLMKIYANLLRSDDLLAHYLNQFVLTQLDVTTMLSSMAAFQADPATTQPANFAAACQWVRSNYDTWTSWLETLPLCDIRRHMTYTMTGCNTTFRRVSFAWTRPDPTNATLPFECDGGIVTLPGAFQTSKSCEWLSTHENEWTAWTSAPPHCDPSFFAYTISSCSEASTREVAFAWNLPEAANPARSSECTGGVALPANVVLDCGYVPYTSSAFVGIAVLTSVVMVLLTGLTALVVLFRERPIIKRSQWPLLVLMLLGGYCLCATVFLFGGPPSPGVCGGRPFVASLGYTTVFGSILAKSLRVYAVFNQKAMKRVVITVWRALQWFIVVLGIDMGTVDTMPHVGDNVTLGPWTGIVAVWLVVDFPHPISTTVPSTDFHGDIDIQQCRSSNFIFPTLSIFWKGLVTLGGVYVAFHIRKADSDFQESVWMFASSCMVIVGGGVMLALTYATTMSPVSTFTLQAVVILLCTVTVMALMLVPKFFKLHAVTPIEVFPSRKTSSMTSSTKLAAAKTAPNKPTPPSNSQRLSSGSQIAPSNSAAALLTSSASQGTGENAISDATSTFD